MSSLLRTVSFLPGVVLLLACTATPTRTTGTTVSLGASLGDDPRVAVRAWEQVHQFHCARDASGAVRACTQNADCADGRVCDTSAGCGCCVAPPPRVAADATLHRYMMTGCTAGRCVPPRFCTPGDDPRQCTMTFDREVPLWVSPFVPQRTDDPRAEVRRELCIMVEPAQECLWVMDLPPGSYTADAPFPTRYEGRYECGGRTCNDQDAVRASPTVGSTHTARLVWDRCGS